jgi:cellulose 1,4-beta-cellobiosidase
MFPSASLLAFSLLAVGAYAQQVGTNTAEVHPKLPTQKCTKSGCTTVNTSIVLDANWRWTHTTTGYTNCYTGNKWDASLCPDGATCAKNCALDGADYTGTYGITASGNSVSLQLVKGTNVGSRVYLMESDTKYQLFKLKNQEFTMDVDMSKLPCGLNGAVYLVEMAADGGMSTEPNNKAGAKYGTGYCDSQCPHDMKFIAGEANSDGWTGSSTNSGAGKYGSCCAEMDIWEANSQAAAYTPHPCNTNGLLRCSGTECGDADERYSGVCDKDGCDFNSWRQGDRTFLGPGKTIDTNKKITLVTQFITSDNTANGDLVEIRRLYVQDGKVYSNSQSTTGGTGNSITESYCSAQKTTFSDNNYFAKLGGLKKMGDSMAKGMVLALSLWDDYAVNMLWLDSTYPTDKDPSAPGVSRGPCAVTSGKPADVEANSPGATVTYSNIKFGDIGTTYSGTAGTPGSSSSVPSGPSSTTTRSSTTPPTSSTAGPSPTGTVAQWGQCGGKDYKGPTGCASPYTCHKVNDYYSQCY